MIFHKKLAELATRRTVDLTSNEKKDKFLTLINDEQKKKIGRPLSKIEFQELSKMFNKPNIPAACFSWVGVPPVILILSADCKIGDRIWKHERVHFQLKMYRMLIAPKQSTFLILSLLSLTPTKNLKIFFDVTIWRYRHLLDGSSSSQASRVSFLEELLNCALIDYSVETLKFEMFQDIDRNKHATFLRNARNFLKNNLDSETLELKGTWRIHLLSFRTRLKLKLLAQLVREALLMPDTPFEEWD